MGQLAGRVAIVTGAARGLGRAFAEALIAHGCSVTVTDRDATILDVARVIGATGHVGDVAQVFDHDQATIRGQRSGKTVHPAGANGVVAETARQNGAASREKSATPGSSLGIDAASGPALTDTSPSGASLSGASLAAPGR